MVFPQYKAIFFHSGKTAGTAIEHALMPHKLDISVPDYELFYGFDPAVSVYLQHATPRFMRSHLEPSTFSDYFKFTVVRNPYDRLLSVYHYQGEMHQSKFGSFDGFVKSLEHIIANPVGANGNHYLPQADYAQIDGTTVVDKVLRFEELPDSFEEINAALQLNLKLERRYPMGHRRWKTKPTREYYSDELAEIIARVYKKDFEQFGYARDLES